RQNLIDERIRSAAHDMKTLARADRHKLRDLIVFLEVIQQCRHRNIAEVIRIISHKNRLILEVLAHRTEPHADVRIDAGVDERDVPIIDVAAQQIYFSPAAAEDEIVADGFVVVDEITFDDVRFVPQAQYEI